VEARPRTAAEPHPAGYTSGGAFLHSSFCILHSETGRAKLKATVDRDKS
jgi:hypothetical protein